MAPFPTHPDLEVQKFTVIIEGRDEPLVVPVLGQEIHVTLPENSKYQMTVHFKVKNRTLKNLHYKQVVTKAGITIRTTELFLGEELEPSEELYTREFPEDTTPGGFFIRGQHSGHATYTADKEVLMSGDWTLEITKK
ncbi:immunoglobulin E-set [Scheffersomyces xylosifermentans]|uniref:immunoglobulin E-set n=1 Tax=Scheffersomyces xylosifermentans TaxID=1304137 RepID=UPI00315D7FB7